VEPDECVVFEDSVNGLRSGMAAKMKVVGLLTTNPQDVVAPLSDLQMVNYDGMTFESISHSLDFADRE
jgi:beta-phosphoglucomutase-like phosphatase (HAD superfamily)